MPALPKAFINELFWNTFFLGKEVCKGIGVCVENERSKVLGYTRGADIVKRIHDYFAQVQDTGTDLVGFI